MRWAIVLFTTGPSFLDDGEPIFKILKTWIVSNIVHKQYSLQAIEDNKHKSWSTFN